VGGDCFCRKNTPLYVLFQKHKKSSKDIYEAVKKADYDAGMLFKMVLDDDKNKNFGQKKETICQKTNVISFHRKTVINMRVTQHNSIVYNAHVCG
jgi:hypothetical protein